MFERIITTNISHFVHFHIISFCKVTPAPSPLSLGFSASNAREILQKDVISFLGIKINEQMAGDLTQGNTPAVFFPCQKIEIRGSLV